MSAEAGLIFDIDTVKIDRSFIQRLTSDPDDAAIVTAIIALARKLNLNVIAEGVESEAQLALLREYLCNNWQGYLFSKPVPADALKELLISNLGVGNVDERKQG
ncbi:EAL domain-containing protein [Thalassospira alkalitolerans]|uniref:EAL domain-containing protein n=1 Tax=Thalassospira alkalitolerans TaxID=1293890 RepID=UPI003AA9C23B